MLHLAVLSGVVCVGYVIVALVSPPAAQVLVVPCILAVVVPALAHNVSRERDRRSGRPRSTVGA